MNKIYEIVVDFYSENVTSTNITKNAEDLNIWFNNNDINTSFIKALFVNQNEEPIDLTDYDVSVNWRLTNRDTIIQEDNIEKIEDTGYVLIEVPSEVINEDKGKIYFNITLEKRDTNETLNSSSFVATLVGSLTDTTFPENKLITNVKNAQMLNGKSYEELTEDIIEKVGAVNIEGLASEEYVNEKVKDLVNEEYVNEKINEIDLSSYVKDNELSNVAKSGSYNDLTDTPISKYENHSININDLDVGTYTLFNCDLVYGDNKTISLGKNNTSTVFVYNANNNKSFIVIANYGSYSCILYNIGEELKQINLSNIAVKDDLDTFVDIDDVNNAINEKITELNVDGSINNSFEKSKEYTDEKISETKTEIDNNNVQFRDTIYQTIIETFAKVPDTYLTNYATKNYVIEQITEAMKGISSGGLTEREVNALIDEKLKDVNVDLSNYYTKQEVDEKIVDVDLSAYLTTEEGDKRYMPANTIIDNKKPAYGEYKTLLKGDMFNKYHEIADFWTCNQSSNHDTRRPIKYIKKIPSTDLFIAYIDNNSSGEEKGFSIFHFLTNKTIEEDNYITISSLGLGIQDNTNYVRFFFSETKPLIFITYFTSTKETHSAMLSINTDDKTLNVDDDIIVRSSSDNLWLYDGDRVFNTYGVNISDDFERIAMVFNKNDTSATNLVIMDIALNDEGKYKFGNKKECVNYVQWGTDYNQYGYLLSNICFINKNTFTIGCYNNSTVFVYSIDDANDAISSVRSLISNGLAICGIVKVGDYLFCYGYGTSYNWKHAIQVLKYNSDNTLTYVTSLACDNNYKARDYNLSKYCPDCMTMGSPYGPGFWISNYYVQDNKIMIMTTCPAGINETYVGTACFNTLTEQFDYYYPNFSWVKRQLTGITFINDEKTKAVGYVNNRMYLFDILKDEPYVVQCGNNILYSYINNLVEETAQLTIDN